MKINATLWILLVVVALSLTAGCMGDGPTQASANEVGQSQPASAMSSSDPIIGMWITKDQNGIVYTQTFLPSGEYTISSSKNSKTVSGTWIRLRTNEYSITEGDLKLNYLYNPSADTISDPSDPTDYWTRGGKAFATTTVTRATTYSPKQPVTTAAPSATDFSQVTHADVFVMKGHWTSGAEDDGIIVYPNLKDVKEETVEWSGVNLPVDIEIYSTKYDSSYKKVKDKLVYKGTGTISSWKDGNMFMHGGIQIPFTSLSVPPGGSFGTTYVTVHVPDGKTYAAKFELTPFSP